TELFFTRTYNPHGSRYTGQLACGACFHQYYDFEELPYYSRNQMKLYSTGGPNQDFLVEYYYIDDMCETPMVFRFDVFDSLSYPYIKYGFSGCKNNNFELGKNKIQLYYGSGYWHYW